MERADGERRVALVPDIVAKFVKAGTTVAVERGAGLAAGFTDAAYEAAGATVAGDANGLYAGANVVARVARPSDAELAALAPGTIVVGFLAPLGDAPSVQKYADAKITALSMDAIPRTTKAQSMDALSSQANIGGYKAVLIAANHLPKFFPMLTTAAGTVTPAKVLVMGAGVAGLQAIATAKRLGAVVAAYDTRAAVAEQIKSLGAKFLDLDLGGNTEGTGGYAKELTPEQLEKQRAFFVKHVGDSDAIITTAAVPGRRAPVLITAEAVGAMRHGSVIVDLAAETGGNCALTRPGEVYVTDNGVTIVGTKNLPSTVATHASQLYAKNVQTLLDYLTHDDNIAIDMTDEIAKGTTIVLDGKIVHEPTLAALAASGGHA